MQHHPDGTPPGVGGPPPGVGGPPPGIDQTTGVLNMPAFGQQYAQAVMSHRYEHLALWYIDIRNFRAINPNYGFMQGNVVLRTLANNIKTCLTNDLPLVRLGADRFVSLTAGLTYNKAEEHFNTVLEKTNEQIAQHGIKHPIMLAGGIYYLRDDDLSNPSFQKPLDYVSIAHRNARKDACSQLVLFTDRDLEVDARRITIEQSIDQALLDGQIQVWYQPQIDYTYGEVIGAEALARWKHPELGWISPKEFIPVLEKSGKVHELDLYVWEEACRSAGRWRSLSDGKPVPISVNVSRTEMFEPDLLDHFVELRTKYDLPKGSLHLEVTESAFVEETERLYDVIEKMREHDMLVEMDDFGSGLSSLNMLKDVPVDVVKLDMGFMRSAVNEDRGGVVLGSVIRMLQGLNTPIIAEGVETLEQAEMLKNMGCHLMQGFHFSRPMPLADFEEYISSNRAVEETIRRERTVSHLDELMSFDESTSYLFNHGIGGTVFFFAGDGVCESILANDQFYEECGLSRADFGNNKIDPVAEVEQEYRTELWRTVAEAREHGSAVCKVVVRISQRPMDCIMRYLGPSNRGDIFSLTVIRSYDKNTRDENPLYEIQSLGWDLDLLRKIVPNGFAKLSYDDSFEIIQISPSLTQSSGLTREEFTRRFHNSFNEAIVTRDRIAFSEAVEEGRRTGKPFECTIDLAYGYGAETRRAHIFGIVQSDGNDVPFVYLLVMFSGDPVSYGTNAETSAMPRIVSFDYTLATDELVIHNPLPDGTTRDLTISNWLEKLESMPDNISRASAATILAIVRDIKHHPTSGFSDIKCNLRGGDSMRWYHINYTCDVDKAGTTTVMHGYAQDANDQMGSTRWWRHQAETDQLTGLLNRNAVEQSMNLSMRTQGAGLMFMMDLDGFKRINDELGHLEGDELLRNVADAFGAMFREGDVVGRYGGDEFVAFVPLVNGDAYELAKKKAKAIVDRVSSVIAADGSHAACSIGVAVSHNSAATFYDLLEVADQAMYESKMAGKGTFTIANAD